MGRIPGSVESIRIPVHQCALAVLPAVHLDILVRRDPNAVQLAVRLSISRVGDLWSSHRSTSMSSSYLSLAWIDRGLSGLRLPRNPMTSGTIRV